MALSRLGEPGWPRLAALVAAHGAIALRDEILSERDLHGLRTDLAARLADMDAERDLEAAERHGYRFIVPGDPDWPAGCDDLALAPPVQGRGGPPLGLWVRGSLPAGLAGQSVAVVGSRSATTYGAQTAGAFAARLARGGFVVVSGAAYGIDQAAHRGALAVEGDTVAVLACGVDRAYPAAHRALIDHIAEVGAVVAEVPPGWAPTRLRFLARNRLIAALTRGTVIVEAALRSGALNTANWAERLSRPVMGVPGPITSAPSEGVHQLIRSGAASLVTEAAEVLELVGRVGEHLTDRPRGPESPRDALTLRQRQVLDAVPVVRAAPLESIAGAAGIGPGEVRDCLARLHELALVERAGPEWRLAPGGAAS
jgi:DNA processing protein